MVISPTSSRNSSCSTATMESRETRGARAGFGGKLRESSAEMAAFTRSGCFSRRVNAGGQEGEVGNALQPRGRRKAMQPTTSGWFMSARPTTSKRKSGTLEKSNEEGRFGRQEARHCQSCSSSLLFPVHCRRYFFRKLEIVQSRTNSSL